MPVHHEPVRRALLHHLPGIDAPYRRPLVPELALPEGEELRIQTSGSAVRGLRLPRIPPRLQMIRPPGSNVFPSPLRRQSRHAHR